MKTSTIQPTDIVSQWQRASENFQALSPEEKMEILVSAGIFTKKGNVAKYYKDVIVPISTKASAKAK